tara:strand:+ start:504 stop:755 length:252 start_codon:yes stop_codon:yes gene_type:complete
MLTRPYNTKVFTEGKCGSVNNWIKNVRLKCGYGTAYMFKEFLSHATQDSNVKTSLVFEHNYKGTDYEKFMTADSDEDALKIDV